MTNISEKWPLLADQKRLLFSVMSTATLRNMIRQSDLDGLEQVVLDGHGQKLIGENASDSKIRTFIKAVPSYMVKRNHKW